MNDNDIIKALEACWLEDNCEHCPMKKDNKCKAILRQTALDLINRQKAELDDLKRDDLPRCKDALRRANEIGMGLGKENQRLVAEIERLQIENDSLRMAANSFKMHYNTARAEAYKEFAERLISMCDKPHWCVWMSEIEDLAEEMTGDQNDD